jgi:hypothetical protein
MPDSITITPVAMKSHWHPFPGQPTLRRSHHYVVRSAAWGIAWIRVRTPETQNPSEIISLIPGAYAPWNFEG